MSTKDSRENQCKLAPPFSIGPDISDISSRKLPALPISKRKLPRLSQSRSGYVITACPEDKEKISSKQEKLATSITVTPPKEKKHSHISEKSASQIIHNIFNTLHTKMSVTQINKRMSGIIKMNDMNIKSKWRPSLKFICDDDELLCKLSVFMSKQYNEENILFLQSVYSLKENIDNLLQFGNNDNIVEKEKINVEIIWIYNNYITHNAPKQINLSYDCYNNMMRLHLKFKDLSINEKEMLFDSCCVEIENLIQNGILSGFYGSKEFQSIARSRNIFSNNNVAKIENVEVDEISDTEYDSDDVEYKNNNNNNNDDGDDGKDVYFDLYSSSKWIKDNKYILSSKGFAPNSGYHEWKIKILKCSSNRVEFGIISNFDKNIEMNEYGICDTPLFGARAVYGYNELIKLNKNKKRKATQHNFYYASYNKDGTTRCNKCLSSLHIHQRKWIKGDIIKISLNLTKSSINFFLNHIQVRKTVSLEKDTTYYPILLYSGNFQFKLIS